MPAGKLTQLWTAAEAAMPDGWELRGVVKGPRMGDPVIESDSWVAFAKQVPGRERVDLPPSVEGQGATPEQALADLAKGLRELREQM